MLAWDVSLMAMVRPEDSCLDRAWASTVLVTIT
jgi:hypothetical protein